ncbi:hypothetical protein L596_028764 [Steinernema carpocapsae]|uniref:Uncharacterized protein n=1 Tax=Steinernema carpocapsae TaxID=34508 RepID=A0A4U5LZB5_STECR|nr:hypothetical protein L596_028764 [Steinernema carpocapsae]
MLIRNIAEGLTQKLSPYPRRAVARASLSSQPGSATGRGAQSHVTFAKFASLAEMRIHALWPQCSKPALLFMTFKTRSLTCKMSTSSSDKLKKPTFKSACKASKVIIDPTRFKLRLNDHSEDESEVDTRGDYVCNAFLNASEAEATCVEATSFKSLSNDKRSVSMHKTLKMSSQRCVKTPTVPASTSPSQKSESKAEAWKRMCRELRLAQQKNPAPVVPFKKTSKRAYTTPYQGRCWIPSTNRKPPVGYR